MFYLQIVMIPYNTGVKEVQKRSNSRENELFQGKPERPKHWFYLNRDWIEDNLMTGEPELSKWLF